METKQNTGAIFKNTNKKADSHPDYKGQINVDGKLKEIALWIKEGKNGKFFSASISEPYVKQEPTNIVEEKDDLPF